jgi:hypothetical protein
MANFSICLGGERSSNPPRPLAEDDANVTFMLGSGVAGLLVWTSLQGNWTTNAKQIPIRIFQHNKIGVRGISPWVASCSELDEPFHFVVLVRRIEIEVQPTAFPRSPGRRLVQRHVWPSPPWISKNHKAAIWIGVLNLVAQGLLPEGDHPIEFMATDDN